MSYADTYGANRLERARRMYDDAPDHHIARVFPRRNLWIVRSQRRRRRPVHYRVLPNQRVCTCPDFLHNSPADPRFVCKHIILVALVQRGGRLLRIRGGIEIAGDIIGALYGDNTTAGALAMAARTPEPSSGLAEEEDQDWELTTVAEKSVSSVNAADVLAFFADTHRLYPLAQVRVAGTKPATDNWDCTFESHGNGDITVAFTGLSGDAGAVAQLRYRVRGFRLPSDAQSSTPRDVLARHVAPAVVSVGSVVTATLDSAAADGGPGVALERLVPCRADGGGGGNGVRALTAHHAFAVDPETGEPRCGHVHTADRLTRWAASGAPEPCPSCVKDKMHLLMLVGAPKRKRAAEDLTAINEWADGLRSVVEGKVDNELRAAVRGVAAVKGTAATGMHRLGMFTLPVIQAALQVQLLELEKLPALVPRPEEGITTRKDEVKQYLDDQGEWPSQGWTRLPKPWAAIVFVAIVAGLPLNDELRRLVTVSWITKAFDKLDATRESKRDETEQKRRRTEEAESSAESGDPAPEAAPATGARAMSKLLATETARRPELLYMRYGRDRCGEVPIRELSLGPLSSYQHIIEWASGHMAKSFEGPQSLLLNWDTGAGKACGIWLALGAAWRTAQFGAAPANPYRAKYFFVTTGPLAYKQDPEKDVWCFYRAAGLEAHAEIRKTRSEQGASKGELWKDFLPARDPTRPETSLRTRIINYEQLRNALLLGNEYGRALYGYELGGAGQGGELKKRIEAAGKKIPSDTRTDIADGDEMMDLLFQTGNVSKFRLRGHDVKIAQTEASIKKLQTKAETGEALSLKDQNAMERLQRKLAGEKAATNPKNNPLDPLRDAVIAIDEADTLFSPNGVIGDRLDVIERAVFHSYAYSGRHAVRLILATATPAHTDVRSAFRLLNMLVVAAKERAHGCGTPGTEEGKNPTIETLLNDHRAMEQYMRQIQNGISRVDVADDTDRFPVRSRTQVPVVFTNANSVGEYEGILARRFPGARAVASTEPGGGEEEVLEETLEGETLDFDDDFAEVDDEFNDIEDAVGPATFADDNDREDGEQGADQDMRETADETIDTGIQKGLDARAMNLRRIAMMLPHPDVRLGRLPPSFQLGHIDFNPIPVQQYIYADDRAPKLRKLLAQIRQIDEASFIKSGYRPKHAILTSISGQLGAPFAAATLAAAGYYWRPMTRHATRKIVFPRPNAEERNDMATLAETQAMEVAHANIDAAIADAQAADDVDRVEELTAGRDNDVDAAARKARSDVWEAAEPAGLAIPWSQPAAMPGSGEFLPEELKPHNPDDRSFVVLDSSMLSMPFESANYIPATRGANNRVYADYVVGGVTELTAQLPAAVHSDDAALQVALGAIRDLARKPLYYSPGTAGLFTSSAMSANDVDVVTQLRDLPRLQLASDVGVTEMLRLGIVRWAPRLSEPQKRAAAKTTLNKMFNQASENGNGQFARIIIMAPEFLVGNDLADVEYVHLLDPPETVPDQMHVAHGGRPFTRDGIQFEGRAWRRCGHANLRRDRFEPEVPTNLSVLSYRLEGRTGLRSDVVIDTIRSIRKSAVQGVRDEVVDAETAEADTIPAVVHVDDIARFLRADPSEQVMLNYVKRTLNSFAFDRDSNVVRDPSAPVPTGYVYNAGDVPLFRPSNMPSGPFVTNDDIPWTPLESDMHDAPLVQLWKAGLVRYQRDAVWGPPDIEQRNIEEELLAGLRVDVATILRKTVQHDIRTTADILAEGSSFMTEDVIGKLPLPERRTRVNEALRVLGIEVLFSDARDLYWTAHEHAKGIPFLTSLAVARRRATYASIPTVRGPTDFSIASYMKSAFGEEHADIILAAGGPPLSNVLHVAAEVPHTELRAIVTFFNGIWSFPVPTLVEQIRRRPTVPGERSDDYHLALFRGMASAGSGRWSRLSTAARALFAPEWIRDDTAKTAANRVVNESLAIHAMAFANRDRDDVPPLPNIANPTQMDVALNNLDALEVRRTAFDVRLAKADAATERPEVEHQASTQHELDAIDEAMRDLQQRIDDGEIPSDDVLVKAASELRSGLNMDDVYNRALARGFTESYIRATSSSGARLPTETYRRMLRISQRLGLDVRDVAADFMMLSVLALRQQSTVRGPMAAPDGGRVKRGEELQHAVLLNIAGQDTGAPLLAVLAMHANARGGAGISAADAVKTLVAEEVEGDMAKVQNELALLAMDGEYEAGLVIAIDDPFVEGVLPFSDALFLTSVKSQHKTFNVASAKGERLIFYKTRLDTPTKVELTQMTKASWNDSLATWIAQARIAIMNLDSAVDMFGRQTLLDVLQYAVEIVMNPDKAGKGRRPGRKGRRPATKTSLELARERVANDLMAQMVPDAIGHTRIKTIDRTAIMAEMDALWAAHGPGSDLSIRGQDFNDVKLVLIGYARVFEGVRLWPGADAVAAVAARTFPDVDGVRRSVLRKLVNAKTDEPQHLLRAINETGGVVSAVDAAAVLLGPGGPREQRTDENPRPELVLPQVWGAGESQYLSTLTNVASAAVAMAMKRALAVGEAAVAEVRKDITDVDVLVWFINQMRPMVTMTDVITGAITPEMYLKIYDDTVEDMEPTANRARRERLVNRPPPPLAVEDMELGDQLVYWQDILLRADDEANMELGDLADVAQSRQDAITALANVIQDINRLPPHDRIAIWEERVAMLEGVAAGTSDDTEVLKGAMLQLRLARNAAAAEDAVMIDARAEAAAPPPPQPTGSRVLLWYPRKKQARFPETMDKVVKEPYDEKQVTDYDKDSLAQYDRVLIVLGWSTVSVARVAKDVSAFTETLPTDTRVMIVILRKGIAERTVTQRGWDGRRETVTIPGTAPVDLTALSPALVRSYGLPPSTTPFAVLHIAAKRIQTAHEIHRVNNAKIIAFIAGTAPEGGTTETAIQIGSFIAQPLKIVEPAHLAGTYMQPADAANFVWSTETGNSTRFLAAVAGRVQLAEGTIVDAWTDGGVVVEMV